MPFLKGIWLVIQSLGTGTLAGLIVREIQRTVTDSPSSGYAWPLLVGGVASTVVGVGVGFRAGTTAKDWPSSSA